MTGGRRRGRNYISQQRARERKGLPTSGRTGGSCQAPARRPARQSARPFSRIGRFHEGGRAEPPPPRPIGLLGRQSEGGAAGRRLGGRRGGQLIRGSGSRLAVRPLWLPTAVLQWHALRPLQQLKLPVEELLVVAALAQGRPPALQMDGWIQPRVPDRQNLRSDLSSWKESEVTLNGPWV
ncbi:uncharacterized protein LOC131188564 isoform X2 [Ahaetulla prasina]|uniref:uncharacterized protein LOC131188564 isoform X2 n=1 Tax=Ahaetulla prasina TaxID=499056 RepID=UPI002648F7E4|nr:uncharacterized protein LOC131188564 isoform X2 [Ahaetulla prasina]